MASRERGSHPMKEFFKKKINMFWSKRSSTDHDPLNHARVKQAATATNTHAHNLASAALQTPPNPYFISTTDEQPNKVATASSSYCKSASHELQQAGGEMQATPNANVSCSGQQFIREQDLIEEKVKQLTVADVDALLHNIEAELQRLDPISTPTTISTSSLTFVKSALSECQAHKDVASCFVQTLPQDLTNEVIGASERIFLPLLKQTLGGMGGVHWAGLGLSFIAWSLDNMDRTSQNYADCLSLLRKVVSLLAHTRNLIGLKDIQNDSHCIQDLEGSTELALRCALVCSSSLNQGYLARFFKAAKVEEVISALEKELEGAKATNVAVGVDVIIKKMPKAHGSITFPLDSEDMVGGVAELQRIFDYLNKDCGELVAACLHGMGGIGKSKRAFLIYQKFQAMVEEKRYRCCRVVLEFEAKDADLPEIQWRILQKICTGEVPKFSDVMEGQAMMKEKLSNIRDPIVLYLDNLMGEDHLLELLPESKYFPLGSKLLITTRNKNVSYSVGGLGIEHYECFEIEKLGMDKARELFFKASGRKFEGSREESTALEKLEDEVLQLCDGLPLALIVVGRYIRVKSVQSAVDLKLWKEVVEAMRSAKPLHGEDKDRLYSRLNFSIDQLDLRFKRAFLDIVVFAVGKPWEYAERFVGKIELQELFDRFLIQEEWYDSGAVVEIHDVFYAMGKLMAGADQSEIRITCEEDFLQIAGSLERIVGLSKIKLSKANLLQRMPHLRVLDDVQINVECSATRLQHLKAITIRSSIPRPMNFNTCSGLKQLSWCQDNIADLEVLKGLTQLEVLKLSAHKSGQLANAEAIKSLRGLRVLELDRCRCILPKTISSLTCLQQLKVMRYEGDYLPGLARLSGLKELSLLGSKNIKSLPKGLTKLVGLRKLDVRKCSSLESLLEGLTKLVGLRKLDVRKCSSLESLPEGIMTMTSLQMPDIDFSGCRSLTLLPKGTPWCWVDHVTSLNLTDCRNLQRLPEEILGLTKLKRLNLSSCESLRSLLEDIARLSKLRFISLQSCSKLEFLPKGITALASLKTLRVSECTSLESLPQGIVSKGLEVLDLAGCKGLKSLSNWLPEGAISSASLGVLILSGCHSLQSLPKDMSSLTSLQKLSLSYCGSLQALAPQEIAHLTSLEVLDLGGCKGLKSLPEEIANCSRLRDLNLYGCENLESLPQALTSLTALETLNIACCSRLLPLPPAHIASLARCNILTTEEGYRLELIKSITYLQNYLKN